MSVPISPATRAKALLLKVFIMPFTPLNQLNYPIPPLLTIFNGVKFANNSLKFMSRYTLRLLSKPNPTHSLDVNQTSLSDDLFACFPYSF